MREETVKKLTLSSLNYVYGLNNVHRLMFWFQDPEANTSPSTGNDARCLYDLRAGRNQERPFSLARTTFVQPVMASEELNVLPVRVNFIL